MSLTNTPNTKLLTVLRQSQTNYDAALAERGKSYSWGGDQGTVDQHLQNAVNNGWTTEQQQPYLDLIAELDVQIIQTAAELEEVETWEATALTDFTITLDDTAINVQRTTFVNASEPVPASAVLGYVVWSSDDPAIAVVDPATGRVRAITSGTCNIIGTSSNAGITSQAALTVN